MQRASTSSWCAIVLAIRLSRQPFSHAPFPPPVVQDVIGHGLVNQSHYIAEHPEWFLGGSWGMTDYNYNSAGFVDWCGKGSTRLHISISPLLTRSGSDFQVGERVDELRDDVWS